MKKLRNFVVMMAVVGMPLFCSSCDKDDEGQKGESTKDNAGSKDQNGANGSDDDGISPSNKDNDDELDPFVKYTSAQTFYDSYKAYTGAKTLIDFRSADAYAAGHLEEAVNLPADMNNTSSDDAQWCKDLKAMYPTTTYLFFYGTGAFEMSKIVAGRASRIGYGKNNTRIFSKGYDELLSVWK